MASLLTKPLACVPFSVANPTTTQSHERTSSVFCESSKTLKTLRPSKSSQSSIDSSNVFLRPASWKLPGSSSRRHSRVSRQCQKFWEVAAPATDEPPEDLVEEVEEKSRPESPPSGAKEFMSKYKEAVLEEDETGVAEVEAQLEAIENDRNYLSQQVASLTEEVSLGKERFLRLNADFDNFRKRAENEKKAMAVTVRAEVVGGLLPMIDNFERAKTAIKTETEGEQKIDNSYQGIYKQFVEAMKNMGVMAVETTGKEFDPNVHEAIMREDSTTVSEGFIVQEFRKGFVLGEKLLRPAMVKVSAGPGPANEAVSEVIPEAVSQDTETEEVA